MICSCTHIRKHIQFKNNKINGENPIQIIQNNTSRSWLKTVLQQQLHNLIIGLHTIFSWEPTKFTDVSLTSSIPWFPWIPVGGYTQYLQWLYNEGIVGPGGRGPSQWNFCPPPCGPKKVQDKAVTCQNFQKALHLLIKIFCNYVVQPMWSSLMWSSLMCSKQSVRRHPRGFLAVGRVGSVPMD